MFLALYAAEVGARVDWLPVQSGAFYAAGSLIALAFLVSGLAASFFHLGRPERAWRSAAMWRTSWLSREVIVLPAFMVCVAACGALHYHAPILRSGDLNDIGALDRAGDAGAILARCHLCQRCRLRKRVGTNDIGAYL